MQALFRHIATLGPIGYSPIAPGTLGSLVGLASVWFFPLSFAMHLLFVIAGAVGGAYVSTSAEKQLGEKDSGKIIIDEFIGFYVAAFSLPHSMSLLTVTFILFRFFDIIKPLMISKLEYTLRNGVGIMADDILAGLYTNLLIHGWLISRNWL